LTINTTVNFTHLTEDRPRILFVCPSDASFIRVDREVLAERWPVEVWRQPGRWANPLKMLGALRRADLVVGWWASWHTFWPFTLAWLMRKPSLLIVGGFDTANMPEIGYGYQQGGLRKRLSRWIMRRATKLVTNSEYSRDEIERNIGFAPERVEVVHHGVPDPYGELPPDSERRRLALSVGFVTRDNLEIKGQRAFVAAAAELPDVDFVLAGPHKDDAADHLQASATPNVTLTGWLEQNDLDRLFREASVYVQPSHHEGFGIAVAEAMLAGCVPVVTAAGALPEVVGGTGIQVGSDEPAVVADGIRRALDAGPQARAAARERILTAFPVEVRRRGLWAAVEELS
jgi:glycosyltransferase involved in cell wall biosynthesis